MPSGWKSGLSSVRFRPKCLILPETMTRLARMQPPLDVPAAEPGRVDRAGLVLEDRDRALDASAERRLDPHVHDRDPRGDDRAVLDPHEIAELAHLAQVVVPARQVEQEVADRLEAHPLADAARGRSRRERRTSRAGRPGAPTR